MAKNILSSIGIAFFHKKELAAENKGNYKTTKECRDYQKKRNEEFDKIIVEVPLGTKDRIKEMLNADTRETMSIFIRTAIDTELKKRAENQQQQNT